MLVPLLALGLPTSATAAILLAAFQQFGLQPGPLLFATQPDLVWGLIASLYIGNVMLLLLNLPLVGLWVKVLSIPRPQLYAGILVFATLGTYTLNNNVVDLILLYLIGVIGFGMRVLGVPVAPCVIGLILGPLAEAQFRRALSISQGDWTVFFTDPLSAAFLAHRRARRARAVPVAPVAAAPAGQRGVITSGSLTQDPRRRRSDSWRSFSRASASSISPTCSPALSAAISWLCSAPR